MRSQESLTREAAEGTTAHIHTVTTVTTSTTTTTITSSTPSQESLMREAAEGTTAKQAALLLRCKMVRRHNTRANSYRCLLSALYFLLSAICSLMSAGCWLLSAVYCLLSTVCCLLVCCLPSAVCCLLSEEGDVLTKACLLHFSTYPSTLRSKRRGPDWLAINLSSVCRGWTSEPH